MSTSMDALAPAALAFRRRSSLERLLLDPALEIGAGGEAVVYEVPGDPSIVAKVYYQPTIERARKLTLMLANPPLPLVFPELLDKGDDALPEPL